jgi:TolB-like protein
MSGFRITRDMRWGQVIGAVVLITVLCVSSHAMAGSSKGMASKGGSPSLAVLYFDYAGTNKELEGLKKGLASMMITDLIGVKGLKVVERARLQAVIKELKLNASRKVDKKTALKIGKLVGARYLVLGTYIFAVKQLVIEARVLDAQTGVYIGVAARAAGTAETFLDVQKALSKRLLSQLRVKLPHMAKKAGKGKVERSGIKRKSPKRRRKMRLATALKYGKALQAKDAGKLQVAKAALKEVLKEAPDFALAKKELGDLLR